MIFGKATCTVFCSLCLDLLVHNWIIDIIYLIRIMIFFKELLLPHFIQVFLKLPTVALPFCYPRYVV